jgi:hypothetical protein
VTRRYVDNLGFSAASVVRGEPLQVIADYANVATVNKLVARFYNVPGLLDELVE